MTQTTGQSESRDFFISYNRHDRAWAEWIAQQLELAGYTTIIQAWDFSSGQNFVLKMHEALRTTKRTLLVLSPTYLTSEYTQPEWAATFVRDPQGLEGLLVPMKVRDCQPDGLLAPLAYITLVDLEESEAREELLSGVRPRLRPTGAFPYPGPSSHKLNPLGFPGSWPVVWTVPFRRNVFFTGREELLARLYAPLKPGSPAALTQPYALHGLGGIGKTQTAVEFASRHKQEYQAVLWVRAETHETLVADLADFAKALGLP